MVAAKDPNYSYWNDVVKEDIKKLELWGHNIQEKGTVSLGVNTI